MFCNSSSIVDHLYCTVALARTPMFCFTQPKKEEEAIMLDFAKAGDYGRRRGLIQDETLGGWCNEDLARSQTRPAIPLP